MAEFEGVDAFAAFLRTLAGRVTAAQQAGRQDAAEIVRQEVLGMFGHAGGGDDGPFPTPPDLAETTQQARIRHGLSPDALELASGALRDSVVASVEADGRTAVGVPDAIVGSGQPGDAFRNIGDVAVAQEEGTGTVPQRALLGIAGFRAAMAAAEAFVAPVIAAFNPVAQGDASHGDDRSL